MNETFNTLNLNPQILKALDVLSYKTMTPIQQSSLPHILSGSDIIAQAKTGSGKTAAFALGLLNSLDLNKEAIHGLILCPTRELAEQVASETRKLASFLPNAKILTLCGGVHESIQEKSLQSHTHIAVGTPGRILRLLEKGALDISDLNVFTLDEADRMLDMGFTDEINEIFNFVPKKAQSLLFSATYPDNIKTLGQHILKKPKEIKVDTQDIDNKIIDVFYKVRKTQDKNNLLYKILSEYQPKNAIIFCRTKKETADVTDFLTGRNIFAGCLNGDLEQDERTEILTKFSNGSLSILVATDVAARGLDIANLEAVINHNMPSGADNYLHRIGRTGRAGKTGLAFSFYNQEEDFRLEEIEGLRGKECVIKNSDDLPYTKKYKKIPPMVTLYISGGKKNKLRPGDIVGALIGEANLKPEDIGDINIQPVFSFVAVKKAHANRAIKGLSAGRIKKKKYKVGLA